MSCFYALFRPQNGWLFKAAASRTVFVFIFHPGLIPIAIGTRVIQI